MAMRYGVVHRNGTAVTTTSAAHSSSTTTTDAGAGTAAGSAEVRAVGSRSVALAAKCAVQYVPKGTHLI